MKLFIITHLSQSFLSKVYLLVTSKAHINTVTKLLWNSPSPHIPAPVRVNAPNQHIFQTVGGNRSTRRKPTQTRRERADSTDSDPTPELDPGP